MANDEQLQDQIIRAYRTPGHPVAFSAPGTVAKRFNISQKRAKKILEHVDSYNLHREFKQPPTYNPFYVHHRRDQVQADLIDIRKIASANDGVQYLLLLIDVFTKFMWVIPMKTKNQGEMRAALNRWLLGLRIPPKRLLTDRGTEFTNAQVQGLLRENNVGWDPALGVSKAGVAERANKTLQILIYKYLTDMETVRYINMLVRLVHTYNNRRHRSLEGMTPAEAERDENQEAVQALHHARYAKIGERRRASLPFKVGDLVRIKTAHDKLSDSGRAYAEQFKGEFFRIMRINRTLPVALYHLKSLDTGELIRGGFYAQHLQRQRGNVWKIETVLRRRTRRGVRELFVKWKYFGPQWNEWIREDQLVDVY